MTRARGLRLEPTCAACERLNSCQAVTLRMVVDLDHCVNYVEAHPSIVNARADIVDLIGPWALLRAPFPTKRKGEDMRKPETVRGLLGEIGRRLGVLDTRKAFQMPAKAMADALQEHVKEFKVNLDEIVAANDLDALKEILDQLEGGDEKPAAAKEETPAPRRGRPPAASATTAKEEEEPAPRRRGKPEPVAAAAEEEEAEEAPRRGRRGKAEPVEEETPAPRRGRRGQEEAVVEKEEEEPEEVPSRGGRRGKPADTGTGDGGAAISALLTDLRKQVDGNSEAIQSLSKLDVAIDKLETQIESLAVSVTFIANDYFQLKKAADKIANVLELDGTLQEYIDGGN